MTEPTTQSEDRIIIEIEPGSLMLVAMVAGFIYGFLMVALDPWLRFPDVATQINWRDALLTASLMGAYGSLLGWTVTFFWRSSLMIAAVIFLTPIITGVVAAWNNANAVFGIESDLLAFLPFAFLFHAVVVGMTVLFLLMALRLPARRALAFVAIPFVMAILTFGALGRIRWENPDAQDVVNATNTYAGAIFDEGDYSIELLNIYYNNDVAPSGNTRIHTDGGTLICRVRLFQDNTDISCNVEER